MGIRKRRLKFLGGAALLSAFGLIIGAAATGQAATGNEGPAHLPAKLPYGMTAAVYNYQQEQSPLDEVATKIETLAAKTGAARDGFFDTEVLPPQHTLIVYWHGAMPAAVSHLIAQSQGAMHIRVIQTRYSLAFLTHQQQLAFRVPGVVSSYLPTDGSGMVIGVSAGRLRPAEAGLRTRITVPMTVTNGGADQDVSCLWANDPRTAPSRCEDLAPFWGGDVIQSNWEGCTGGFGVKDSSGNAYMMTAAHCSWNGSAYVNGITFCNGWCNETLGNSEYVPGSHDGAIISTPGGTGALYYDGPGISNGDTANTKSVAGYQIVSVGDNLCESGAFGGVHCGSIVRQLNQSVTDKNPNGTTSVTWTGTVLATSLSGSYVIGGDSGGPWFSLDGGSQVWAKGITNGYTTSGTKYNVFTPVSTILSDTHTYINIG